MLDIRNPLFWLLGVVVVVAGLSLVRSHFGAEARRGGGAEMAAHQGQASNHPDDSKEPKQWISDVEHSQNVNQCCAQSCRFKLMTRIARLPLSEIALILWS